MIKIIRIGLLMVSLVSAIWYIRENQSKLISFWTLFPLISLIVPVCVTRLIRDRFTSTLTAFIALFSLIGMMLFIRAAIYGGKEGLEWFGVIFFFTLFHTALIWGGATIALCAMKPNKYEDAEPYPSSESPSSIRTG
ncbi:hypothetical protein P3T73_06955 [Kiritimatiellota bacterium B12222]|nr:hypothetical protein P3T73_06955 [Kiritimatiellota bacterium B12222]